MRVATRRTGLSPDVLRAWEKRYKAVIPYRSAGGQRLYSDEDLERLALLTRVTTLGRSISQVAKLRTDELRTLLMGDESALDSAPERADETAADDVRIAATRMVEAFDGGDLENVLRRGALRLGLGALIDRVIVPMMGEIEDRRHRGELSPAQERFAGNLVARILEWIRETGSLASHAPHLALATTAGEQQELGIQIAGAVAATLAWRVTYLGGNLPADSIVGAARQTGAQVLALSFVSDDGARGARGQLGEIRDGLPPAVAVIVVGAGVAEARSDLAALGLSVMSGQEELLAFLQSYTSGPTLRIR